MKTGIYGGTFSPPHFGHVGAALAFCEQLKLDMLYVVPAAIPPHKKISSGDSPVQRLEMTRLAFDSVDARIKVSDYEIAKNGISYTAETLAYFRAHIHGTLYLLCGTDMFLTLDEWYQAADIFRCAHIVCARREQDAHTGILLLQKAAQYEKRYSAGISFLQLSPLEMSSTEIRERVKRREDISACVPEKVQDYIETHQLYRE